jgi:hypothetical protein
MTSSDGKTKHAFLGLGFRERPQAYDFQAAVFDHLKYPFEGYVLVRCSLRQLCCFSFCMLGLLDLVLCLMCRVLRTDGFVIVVTLCVDYTLASMLTRYYKRGD